MASHQANDAEKGIADLVHSPTSASKTNARFGLPYPPKPARPGDSLVKPKARVRPARKANFWITLQLWFNTYRKFYTFVVSMNVIGLILAATNMWKYPRDFTGAFILGNLLTAILMRNELFGRLLYLIVTTLFAKVRSPITYQGSLLVADTPSKVASSVVPPGVHISLTTPRRVVLIFINHKDNHDAVLIMGVITNLAVAVSILSAFPWVRNTYHNVFERHHRFVGWLGLLCTWAFVVLGDSYDATTHTWRPNGIHIIRQQQFWFAFGMTVFIIIPWLTVREVKVDVEIPSPKVVILRFERGMQQGLLARISRASILEYHAFGIISEGVHSKEHFLICGVQGDFTRELVKNPPTTVWTRQLKFAGVSNTSTLYKRGIRVCTGTGLGAALSTCIQSPDWYLIWIGSDQEKTFGPTISGLIHKHLGPERSTLWDSKERGGRPDVMKLITEAYTTWGAEVVFITSNWGGNKEMMQGCKAAGIPAFGTLWDF
ncbi:related to non-ribosomal peptide synthetase [Armillaria ostoyae]|uniref:Related to non-ribosomal peptide synthetase n=1 Tax=Armillaria ostoyae TaxID=47428 RepID=A0A284QN14_ARMOS|nr:related to non-ribosomal peptide synthetase [Armillaria ostoyae]